MNLLAVSVGDEVAILPTRSSSAAHTLDVVRVPFVNEHLIRLPEHCMYSRSDPSGLTPRSLGYIELATDDHRKAIRGDP
jgi:hypothetical protein